MLILLTKKIYQKSNPLNLRKNKPLKNSSIKKMPQIINNECPKIIAECPIKDIE